ncbi:MAG: hypothetical protein Kow002_13300 [Anaerolineales bacterium]
MGQKEKLIELLQDTRKELADLVSDIPEDKEIYPSWRIKELLAHFAGWDDAAVAGVRACLAGQNPIIVAPLGPDDYNRRTVSEREALPLGHIIKEFDLNRELLIDLVKQVPEEKLEIQTVYPWGEEGTLENLVRGMAEHELFHIREIKALKPKLIA